MQEALTLQQQQLQFQQLAQAQAQAQAAAGRGLPGGNEALLAMLRNATISEQPQTHNLGRSGAFQTDSQVPAPH